MGKDSWQDWREGINRLEVLFTLYFYLTPFGAFFLGFCFEFGIASKRGFAIHIDVWSHRSAESCLSYVSSTFEIHLKSSRIDENNFSRQSKPARARQVGVTGMIAMHEAGTFVFN